MKTLVLISSGLDSITCLAKLLHETDDEVSCLYVNLANNNHKAWCEEESLRELYGELKKIRDFHHETHEMGSIFGDQRGISLQPLIFLSHAALYMTTIEGSERRLQMGYTRKDDAIQSLDIIRNTWNAMYAISDRRTDIPTPSIEFPLMRSTKRHSFNFLRKMEKQYGINIISKLWTCEWPHMVTKGSVRGYKACGKCVSCERLNKLIRSSKKPAPHGKRAEMV